MARRNRLPERHPCPIISHLLVGGKNFSTAIRSTLLQWGNGARSRHGRPINLSHRRKLLLRPAIAMPFALVDGREMLLAVARLMVIVTSFFHGALQRGIWPASIFRASVFPSREPITMSGRRYLVGIHLHRRDRVTAPVRRPQSGFQWSIRWKSWCHCKLLDNPGDQARRNSA